LICERGRHSVFVAVFESADDPTCGKPRMAAPSQNRQIPLLIRESGIVFDAQDVRPVRAGDDKNIENLTRIADRQYIVERGRAVWSDTSQQLIDEPELHRDLGGAGGDRLRRLPSTRAHPVAAGGFAMLPLNALTMERHQLISPT
jgi:hypothetical protein